MREREERMRREEEEAAVRAEEVQIHTPFSRNCGVIRERGRVRGLTVYDCVDRSVRRQRP